MTVIVNNNSTAKFPFLVKARKDGIFMAYRYTDKTKMDYECIVLVPGMLIDFEGELFTLSVKDCQPFMGSVTLTNN